MIVVKVGGSEGIDYDAVCDDVAALAEAGQRIVLVHGGSHLTNTVAEALGHPPRFITSPSGFTSRHTDRRTLEIFEMVYCGQMNKGIVERLLQRGIDAVGLSGLDGRLWSGPRKAAIRSVEDGRVRIVRDSYTGKVETVNTKLLNMLLDQNLMPVLTPPAVSTDGEAINVDGDRAAAATAAALGAESLLLLSNVPGVLEDLNDPTSLIESLTPAQLERPADLAEGRMRIKLLAAAEALAAGVSRVVIGSACIERPVSRALEGAGTVMSAETADR